MVFGWYGGSLRLPVGGVGFVGFVHILRLALGSVVVWYCLGFFFPPLSSPGFFWCWIGLDCIALSPLVESSLLLYFLASSDPASIGLALPCLVLLDVVLDFLFLSGLVLPCLAAPCLGILISDSLVCFPLLRFPLLLSGRVASSSSFL